jgi:hypothetical protein
VFFVSRMPCAECGAAVERNADASHVCDPARRVDFQVLAMRSAIAGFETDFETYLAGKEGRFEAWLAARDVRRTA